MYVYVSVIEALLAVHRSKGSWTDHGRKIGCSVIAEHLAAKYSAVQPTQVVVMTCRANWNAGSTSRWFPKVCGINPHMWANPN